VTVELPSVLVVDDMEANLVAFAALLEDLPCVPVFARSGNEALRLLLKGEYALMLLDVQMPDMDGYEVARHSRTVPRTRDLPIIFVTAMSARVENELRGYGTGAVDYLFKPVNGQILRSKVRVFLDLERGRRALAEEVKSHERTHAALEQSNAALRHFTHAASHDLRAPLRAASGFLEALEEEAGGTLEARPADYLRRARRATDRMSSLLASLLAFAGLEQELAFVTVDCDELVEQVRSDLAQRLAEVGAELEIAPLPQVSGVPARLYQLFLNLVGNALKFARPGVAPRVRIFVENESEPVFCVSDNGRGIALSHHDRIFAAFHRLHSQSAIEGSGLGLAICRQIVEQHRGRIWVRSIEGEGATFCFTLGAPGG
jgi:two-component system, sensor histidine kinase and response regulator